MLIILGLADKKCLDGARALSYVKLTVSSPVLKMARAHGLYIRTYIVRARIGTVRMMLKAATSHRYNTCPIVLVTHTYDLSELPAVAGTFPAAKAP